MSYEDELVSRLQRENAGVKADLARRAHTLKMGGAGLVMAVCFGLFATGILGGKEKAEQARALAEASDAGRKEGKKVDPATAGKRLAAVSGPEITAMLLGAASALYFMVLLMRLRRLD